MADFQEQVMGITGLTIDGSSTAPSRPEFSSFLNDGVIDVTHRWLSIKPQDVELFVRESSTTASNGLDIGGAEVISVLREAGADGDTDGSTAWRSCRKIPASMQSRVVDTESLNFASKYNPAYAIDDNGVINVYPIPDGTDDGFRAYYVNNAPAETDGTALDHASTGIKYFPKDKVYLVVIYAGIKSLQSNLGATSISTFSLSATAPGAPSVGTVSYSAATNADATAAGASTSTASVIAKADISGNPPTYTAPTQTFDTGQLETFLETEEDSELAQIQIGRLNHEVAEFQADIQNALNVFNDQNATYQANVQAEITKHNTDLQVALANANNLAREYLQEAQQTTSIDQFNKQQDQALALTNAAKTMEAIVVNNNNILADFTAELQRYQALVAAEVQTYQQEIAEKSTEYQWMTARLKDLKEEYDRTFLMAAPKQQQANA